MDREESHVSLNRTQKNDVSTICSNFAVYVLHGNVRVFANAIAALSKLSDELYLRPQKDGICLKAFNKTRSAYGVFLFVEYFFSTYDTKSVPEIGAVHIRVAMKTALSLFKSAYFMEKNLVSCTIRVDCLGRELHVDYQQTCDVSRSFNVNIMERGKPFGSEFNKNGMENIVTINASEVASFLNEMSGNEELIICVQNDKFVLQNCIPFTDGIYDASACRTEITLQKTIFKKFVVRRHTEITLCMKEFKAIITFARQHLCDVSLFFGRPGRPLIVAVEDDSGYSSEFIISTVEGDDISDDGSLASVQRPDVQFYQNGQNATFQSSQCANNSHPNDLQSQSISQQSLPLTQPTTNEQQSDGEKMENDEFGVENVAVQNISETRPTCSHIVSNDFLFGQKTDALNMRPDTEELRRTDNSSLRKRLARPNREVNVEFQRRFLGIGVRKQKQSQASATVNTIVEPTQFEMDRI